MTSPQITVVIPTLRGRQWLPACLDALARQTFRDFEIVVVDNASSDGTREWLAARDDVRVIRNDANAGFAEACNQGIRASAAPYVALLNDDTQVDSAWLAALLRAMQQDDAIGACASLMVYADRPAMVQSAGICIDRAAIAWDRLAGRPLAEAAEPCDIFGASGGAVLYRRAMLDAIGLFDARFFAYLEDVDLAWRAQCAGWRCRYVPGAVVLHHTSATSGAGSPFKNRLLGRNKIWLAAKNARGRDLPIVMLYDLLAVLYAGVARRDWSHLRGRLSALGALAAMRQARGRCSGPLPFSSLVAPWRVTRRYTVS